MSLTQPQKHAMHKSTVEGLHTLYLNKNSDYGGSFEKLFKEYGLLSVVIKLSDKLERLKSLSDPSKPIKVVGESLMDTLLDMANYAIMAAVELLVIEEAEGVSDGAV